MILVLVPARDRRDVVDNFTGCMKRFLALALMGSMFASPAQAQAPGGDALIEGAKLCTRHLSRYERQYGIPTHLLSAIASTESGRYHQGLKISVPWPWTINAEGKGHYFDSKAEAIAFARQLQLRGVVSMDVGCMQVNLYHHSNAFVSLEQAFEPENNIAYAASFLRSLYQESNSWKLASSHYHSKTPQRGTEYSGIVYDKWFKIVDALRSARLQSPGAPVQMAANEPATPRVTHVNGPTVSTYQQPISRLPEQVGKKLPTHHTPRMNSMAVSDKRDDGIIVVKPSITVIESAKPIQMAQARTDRMGHMPGDASVIRVNGNAPVKKSGPTFIFND